MGYKAKHRYSAKKRKNNIEKATLKKMLSIFCAILISITVIPSYAYLTGTDPLTLNNSSIQNLDITNGNVNINLSNTSSSWTNVPATSTPTIGASSITNPYSGQQITYGPVYLDPVYNSSNTNLTSNIDIQTEYIMKKNGGTPETTNSTMGNAAEPFEVIVGDVDNFNNGFGSYDCYSGNTTGANFDMYPKSYDAQGTDRRMVTSGFYNFAKGFLTQVDSGNINNGLKSGATNATFASYSSGAYYGATVNNATSVDGITFPKNLFVTYDGFSDRLINGTYKSGSAAADCNMDTLNWRYLQKAKPVTFKYTNIPDNQKISTVSFQIFTNDLQSGLATNVTSFSAQSSSYFRIYLSGVGGANKVEVTDFAKVINKYAQDNVVGDMITLNLPTQYFNLIKNSGGLGNGLELLIDDTRPGISGDSYAIDFAKMTVNNPAARGSGNTVTVKGNVVDINSTPLSGIKVTTGDGLSAVTDSNGAYTISGAAPGILSLTFSNYKYSDAVYVYGNATAGSTVDLTASPQTMVMSAKPSINANEKYSVQFILQKCDSNGNAISGESPIVLDSKNLNSTNDYTLTDGNGTGTQVMQSHIFAKVQPGFRYKLTYVLNLKSYDDIGDVMPFNLTFSSRIKAKITQENNPGWTNDGAGSSYQDSLAEYTDATTTATGTSTYSDSSKTQVYFEKPTTAAYWTASSPTLTLYTGTGYSPSQNGSTQTMVQDTNNSGWYKYTYSDHASIPANTTIKIVDGGNSSNASGYLYYFSTQKVFICTN